MGFWKDFRAKLKYKKNATALLQNISNQIVKDHLFEYEGQLKQSLAKEFGIDEKNIELIKDENGYKVKIIESINEVYINITVGE